jgi:hypothetical protein
VDFFVQLNPSTRIFALMALLGATGLPSEIALELGERTVRLARGHIRLETAIGKRLGELSAIDIDAAFRLAERVVRGTLTERWAFLTFEMRGPVLPRVLGNGTPATGTVLAQPTNLCVKQQRTVSQNPARCSPEATAGPTD